MFEWYRRWRRQRILQRSAISAAEWQQAFARLPLLDSLDAGERTRLRELATLFLHDKQLQGVGTVQLSRDMLLIIALQACLPVLALGLAWYDGWRTVLVYPDDFAIERREMDESGVVHQVHHQLAGEAWQDGPVILSWNDLREAGAIDGYNLVIHEFAHKLDMRNGVANGFPPLPADMAVADWTSAFAAAYGNFQARVRAGHAPFDAYGATSPAEFFAVASEVFFERPGLLRHHYPLVYCQLQAFYRQDPLSRLGGHPGHRHPPCTAPQGN